VKKTAIVTAVVPQPDREPPEGADLVRPVPERFAPARRDLRADKKIY